MPIVPLTTPLPVYALGILGFEVPAPLAWLLAALAVLAGGVRRRRTGAQTSDVRPAA
jgi:MYXO-CTERM domain-containing protein